MDDEPDYDDDQTQAASNVTKEDAVAFEAGLFQSNPYRSIYGSDVVVKESPRSASASHSASLGGGRSRPRKRLANTTSPSTRVMIELPMQYATTAVGESPAFQDADSNEKASGVGRSSSKAASVAGLSILPKPRLVATSTIPLYSSTVPSLLGIDTNGKHGKLIQTENSKTATAAAAATTSTRQQDVACRLGLSSGLRGRTGYTDGSVHVEYNNRLCTSSDDDDEAAAIGISSSSSSVGSTSAARGSSNGSSNTSTSCTTMSAGFGSCLVNATSTDATTTSNNSSAMTLPAIIPPLSTPYVSSVRLGISSSHRRPSRPLSTLMGTKVPAATAHDNRHGKGATSSSSSVSSLSMTNTTMGAHLHIPLVASSTGNMIGRDSAAAPASAMVVVSASAQQPLLLAIPFVHVRRPGQPQRENRRRVRQLQLNVDAQCSTQFRYRNVPTNLQSMTNVSLSSTPPTSCIDEPGVSRVAWPRWTVRCGLRQGSNSIVDKKNTRTLSSMVGSIRPTFGVLVQSIHLPNLLPLSSWRQPARPASSSSSMLSPNKKCLDLSLTWNGSDGAWQLGGWWNSRTTTGGNSLATQKRPAHKGSSSSSTSRSQTPPLLQRKRSIGLGVCFSSGATLSRGTGEHNAQTASSNTVGAGMLSWIITWTEGEHFALRIPIHWASMVGSSAASTSVAGNVLYHQAFQYLYLSLVSTVLHDVIGHCFASSETKGRALGSDTTREAIQQQLEFCRDRARKEAILQQSLMERQAQTRMAAEKERNGLVIRHAVYYVCRRAVVDTGENNSTLDLVDLEVNSAIGQDWKWGDYIGQSGPDEVEILDSFDVTIPVQFWVNDSKLQLYGASNRSHLLGFYDLGTWIRRRFQCSPMKVEAAPIATLGGSSTGVVSSPFGWLRQFVGWNGETAVLADPTTDHVGMEGITEIVSELYIQYTYKGRLYCAIVRADEEVRLPRASAD